MFLPRRLVGPARILAIAAGLILFAACDTAEPQDAVWMTPQEALPEIERIVDVFLAEAEARGRTAYLYKPTELHIIVADSLRRRGQDVCGFGEADAATERPVISFGITRECWDRTTWDREILVFHELVHALLGRDHRDDALPNGLRASIMNGGTVFGLYSEARAGWRGYYVDELFDSSTPVPVWGY